MIAKIRNKARRINSLKVWSTITGVAVTIALVLTFLPMQVSVNTGGLLSIRLNQVGANPDWLSGWGQRIQFTVDQTYIDGNLTNFPILVHLSSNSSLAKSVTLTPEATNPVLTATETWEGTAVIEPSIIMDGSQCDMWYRGYNAGVSKIGYAYATDSKCAVWTKYASNPLTDIPTGYQLPYVLEHDGTYYMFVQNGAANGDIYLYSSTNKTSWAVMNSGNPVLVHSGTSTDWYHLIYNVGVTIVGSTWHMLIEGRADSGAYSTKFQIGYSYSTLQDLNWNAHLAATPVIPTSGNPDLIYIPDRNSLLSLHGEDSGTYWTIVADYASLSDNLTLAASWHRSSNFQIAATNIHVSDPHLCVTNFTKDYNIITNYCYNQVNAYQTYSNLSLNQFYDKLTSGYDVSCVFDELQSDANRKKIAVTTDDGETECYVEIEKWDDANEQAWLWIKAPSVSGTLDTGFYLYYDSTHADNTAYVGDPNSTPAENVWDANFKFVSHMRDDPDTSHIRDSTSQSNDGTKKGAAEPVITTSGKVADAQDFDGSNDYVVMGNQIALTSGATLETLIKFDATTINSIFSKRQVSPAYNDWQFYLTGTHLSILFWGLTPIDLSVTYATAGISTGNWYHLAARYDGSTIKLFVNGVEKGTVASTGTISNNDVDTRLGNDWYTSFLNGMEDEVRVSNTGRTSAWIKATYYTEIDGLLDWGSGEPAAPEITNTPNSKDFGILEVNTTSNTAINYFTLNNTGNCPVDITIQGTDVTGGDDTWTLSGTATPGENIYGLYAGLDDADDNFDIVVNATANAFVSNLAEATTQAWGLKLYMPTSLSGYDAQQMSGTITLIASAA